MNTVAQGKTWATELLLAHGANPYLKDKDGSTAIDIARRRHGQDAADNLVAKSLVQPPSEPIRIYKPLVLKRGMGM